MGTRRNRLFYSKLFQWFIYRFIRTYSLTLRLEVQNEGEWLESYLSGNEAILLCCHHQQFFPAIRYFQKYRKYKPGLMISMSRDGELISAVANRTGWTTVRGSSSRGGLEALRGMIEHLGEHRLAAHIIDGPRGPFGVVKPGAVRLAHATGATIVPFYTTANRAWYARSWDRFLCPKPFSKVILRFGKKIKLDPEAGDFEAQRASLEDIMFKENEAVQRIFR